VPNVSKIGTQSLSANNDFISTIGTPFIYLGLENFMPIPTCFGLKDFVVVVFVLVQKIS
jgi:hypothetical protein